MMICPETYYEEYLKGKNAEQIMTAIRGLKQEMGRLKNIAEHPDYQCMIHPSEGVRISCIRDYIERAKQAFAEAGGTYIPSKAELKAEELNANIPFVCKVEFSIGGYFGGFETRTYTIDGESVKAEYDHTLMQPPSYFYEPVEDDELDKESFLEGLADLHLGEWRKNYDPSRFGYSVLDGTQWHLYLYFSNGHKPLKIHGSNDYPYNFDRLLDHLNIDPWKKEDEENDG